MDEVITATVDCSRTKNKSVEIKLYLMKQSGVPNSLNHVVFPYEFSYKSLPPDGQTTSQILKSSLSQIVATQAVIPTTATRQWATQVVNFSSQAGATSYGIFTYWKAGDILLFNFNQIPKIRILKNKQLEIRFEFRIHSHSSPNSILSRSIEENWTCHNSPLDFQTSNLNS